MPPVNSILSLFGRSPIRPIQEHMRKAVDCTIKLNDFIDAAQDDNWREAKKIQKTIAKLEKKADEMKLNIRQHLPSGFFLPVPRVDLLQMLTLQDKIANKAEDIAGLMLGRKMKFPEEVIDSYRDFLNGSIDATKQAQKAINELDALLETGFKGQEVGVVTKIIIELDKAEQETDKMQIDTRQQLFAIERNYYPIDMMFLYKIIDWTGDLADRAQRVGGQLQVILAR